MATNLRDVLLFLTALLALLLKLADFMSPPQTPSYYGCGRAECYYYYVDPCRCSDR